MKKIIFLLLILGFILVACSQSPVEEVYNETELSEELKVLPEIIALVNFLEKVYNISDPSEFEVDIELMLKDASEGKVDYLGYENLCTEDGLKGIFANRLQSYYGDVALAKNFVMSISNIAYAKISDKDAEGTILNKYRTISYEYSVELLIEYSDGKSDKIIEEGYVNVKLVDEEWKVSLFSLKEYKDFWKEVRPN